MVVKSKKKSPGKKKVKVLNLKKETVKNLSGRESKRIKGGTGYCASLIQPKSVLPSGSLGASVLSVRISIG